MVSEPNDLHDQLIASGIWLHTTSNSVCNVNDRHQHSSLAICVVVSAQIFSIVFTYIVRLLEFQLTGITVGIVQFCEWLYIPAPTQSSMAWSYGC